MYRQITAQELEILADYYAKKGNQHLTQEYKREFEELQKYFDRD